MTAPKLGASANVGFNLRGEPSRKAAAGDIITVRSDGDDRMLVRVGKQSADTTKPARGMTMALDRAGAIALGRYLISAGQRMTAMEKPLQQAEARMLTCNVIAGQDVFCTVSARETTCGDFLFDTTVQNVTARGEKINIRETATAAVGRDDVEAFARALLVMALDR